jgi:hypothetical protein
VRQEAVADGGSCKSDGDDGDVEDDQLSFRPPKQLQQPQQPQQSNAFWPPLTDFAVFRRVFFLSRELLFFFEVLIYGPNILRRKSAGRLSLSSA